MCDTIHQFEKAGLGKAPFRYVGYSKEVYVACHGAPVQPGSTCDYCSNAIMHVFYIQSADGQRFKVGSDCVLKTGDRGLQKVVNAEIAKRTREERHAKEAAKIAEGREWVEANREALAKLPHPTKGLAEDGRTLLDYLTWIFKHAGNAGNLRAIKNAKKLLEAS